MAKLSSVTNYSCLIEDSLTRLPELLVKLIKDGCTFTSGQLKYRQSLVGILLIAFGAYVYYWQKYSFWSRKNIRTPTPIPFFGNFLSFIRYPRQHLELEWPKKYGKLYGFYMGTKPYLVCSDISVMNRICIKDFDKFPNHFFVGVKNKYQKHFLINQHGDDWRGMRAILTPTFTSGKIKIMHKILDSCADGLVETCKQLIDSSSSTSIANNNDTYGIIDLKEIIPTFSMGSSISSFYGLNFGDGHNNSTGSTFKQRGDKNLVSKEGFAQMSREAFKQSVPRFIASHLLPIGLLNFINLPQFAEGPMDFFAKHSRKIVENRQKSTRRHNDYLQLLIEAKAPSLSNETEVSSNQYEEHHAMMIDNSMESNSSPSAALSSWRPSNRKKLTGEEIHCQAMMLMMVATETTSTLLCHTIYLLAHHPSIQQRLFDELVEIRNEYGKFDYEKLTSCTYLDCVISESLRLMPPALIMDREANEDYFIDEYNLSIPKGTVIVLPFYAIHMDPDNWPEPDKFDPERFSPENKCKILSGSYCPFGIGPRSCIGFRFALTEAKVGIARLISEFVFEQAPGTKYPPVPHRVTFILNNNKNLVTVIRRRKDA